MPGAAPGATVVAIPDPGWTAEPDLGRPADGERPRTTVDDADPAALGPRVAATSLTAPRPARPVVASPRSDLTASMPGVLLPAPADQRPEFRFTSSAAAPALLPPAPAPDPDEPDTGQAAPRTARIRGYRCENGHLNDPRSPSCRHCGALIDERVGGLVAGTRPPLGRLVFDDGAAHVVDGSYLVGRMPEVDDRVRAGELRPIAVEDDGGSVSRVHAEVRVSGWDVIVVDTGSRNGTYVSGAGEGVWTALPPRRSRRLLPGTKVRMGARMFVFESSSTVR